MSSKLPAHITKIRDGKFRVRYQRSKKFPVEYDKIFDNATEAITANNEYLAKNTLNLHTKVQKMGFSEFCDYYLEWLRNKPKKPAVGTIRSYKRYINTLKIAFGNPNIKEMDSFFISNIIAKESKRKKRSNGKNQGGVISSNTLHHEYAMLSILFGKMYDWNFISSNPMKEIEAPSFETKEIEVPEYEEIEDIESKILTVSNIRDKLQFLISFYTGMREEEVAGLHNDRDIDRENCIFTVNTAIVQDEDGNYVEAEPKSRKSKRELPFPPTLLQILDEYLVYRKNYINFLKLNNPEYVEIPNLFLNKDGHFYRPYRISRLWSKFAKNNDINLTFHGLRHYYITNQMNFNKDLTDRDVQDLAGHSDIRTTQRYNHASKKRINKNAVNIFNKFGIESLFKNGNDIITIPIEHIASIIIGNPDLSNVQDLKITLEVITNTKVDFYNISQLIEKSKKYIISSYPSLERLEQYKYSNESNDKLIENLKRQFGKEIKLQISKFK